MQLYKLSNNYQQAILGMESMLEAGELNQNDIQDTLEGLQGELQDKAINVALHIKNLRSDLAQLQDAKASFDARIKSAQSQIEFYELYLDANLRKANITEIKSDYCVIKYKGMPPAVEITGEVPDSFMRIIPESKAPDKKAIGDAIKAGQELDFAELLVGRVRLDIK